MFLAFLTNAQITISSANMPVNGDIIIMVEDETTSSVNFGNSGANQLWDLSGLQEDYTDTILFQSPNSLLGFSLFSSATLGVKNSDSSSTFIRSNATEFTFLGDYEIYNGRPDTNEINWNWLTFPATMGTQTTTIFDEGEEVIDISGFGLGFDSVKFHFKTSINSEIDGWGVVKTPAGNWEALRQKQNIQSYVGAEQFVSGNWEPISLTLLTLFGIDTGLVSENAMFWWWSNDANAKFLVATVDTGDGFMGNSYLKASPSSPITEVNNILKEVEISVYPNPVFQNLNIDLSTESGKMILRNILGQKLAEKTLQKGVNSIGFNELNKGTYLLEIYNHNGKIIKTEKVEVVRD